MRTVTGSGTVVIEVTIVRSGAVRSARVARSSGNPPLDLAALAAVSTAPYPPLPASIADDALTLQIPFRVR